MSRTSIQSSMHALSDSYPSSMTRVGGVALGFTDAHDAASPTSLLGSRDVVIGFSHGGQSRESLSRLRGDR